MNEIPEMIRPSPWVERFASYIPVNGRVLDLACGSGRHTRFLAARGYSVLAVDRDAGALAVLRDVPGVAVQEMDLEGEAWPLEGLRFDGIVVTNYLWRARLSDVMALLAPGGILIYDTFMLGNEAYGKPSNPDFLLQPGELRQRVAAAGLRELAFAEGLTAAPKPAMRQSVCAVCD
ncbi:class I SAM-dependent methyltransferase [Dechloromonas denitrificans]|uniref:class I SAM-dependent methyltransferase n=1 Tax=Dechloromonas denitrificans TaxID=281362 RepID=UPI00299D2422|nr:class I SAM-dependent methyltransferase [Dechloromonas denitrificans]